MPAFKVITTSGKESVLIGSLHIPYFGLRQPAPSVMDGAAHFVIEHVTENEAQDLLPELGLLRDKWPTQRRRASWAQFVTEDQEDRVVHNLGCMVPSPRLPEIVAIAFRARSPRTAATYAYLPCVPRGELSRDELMQKAAEERHVPLVSLETPDQILARRRLVPDRIYANQVMNGVVTDLPLLYRRLVLAINAGDFDAVASIVDDGMAAPADQALFHEIMVAGRNRSWMPALRTTVDEGRAVIVVGAAHLPGDDGLLSLLRQAGYRVEAIRLPAIDSSLR